MPDRVMVVAGQSPHCSAQHQFVAGLRLESYNTGERRSSDYYHILSP